MVYYEWNLYFVTDPCAKNRSKSNVWSKTYDLFFCKCPPRIIGKNRTFREKYIG
jgi:hypothetical protein